MKKKLMSLVLAMTTVLSALPAASAISAEPLSKYAGKTVPIQAVVETENGWVSELIEVTIPKNATKAKEEEAIHDAVLSWSSASTFSTRTIHKFRLSKESNITLTDSEKKVGGGARPAGVTYFDNVLIDLVVGSTSGTAVKLRFQVRDVDNPNCATQWCEPIEIIDPSIQVTIACGGLPTSSKGIGAYGKTTIARPVTLSSCEVFGIVIE